MFGQKFDFNLYMYALNAHSTKTIDTRKAAKISAGNLNREKARGIAERTALQLDNSKFRTYLSRAEQCVNDSS